MTKQQRRLTRDGAIVTVALTLSGYEVILGDARPQVLTFLTMLLLYPVAARLDRQSLRRMIDRGAEGEDNDSAETRR